jgi:hypothetical protein
MRLRGFRPRRDRSGRVSCGGRGNSPDDRESEISRFLSDPKVQEQRRNTAQEIGRAPRDVSESSIEDVLILLPRLERNEGLLVGHLTGEVVGHWPTRNGDAIVVPRKYRKHYKRRHPETRKVEADVPRTLRDPAEAFIYAKDPTVVSLWSAMGRDNGLWVSVQLPYENERFGILKSARLQSNEETERQRQAGRMVWRKK